MRKIETVIPILQDKSIVNIITYTLNNNKIKTYHIDEAFKKNILKSNSLIIIDNDLDNTYTKLIFKKLKKLKTKPHIILAINKNYRYFLTKQLSSIISGIIYKPFDIEELLEIINHKK